MMMDIEKLPKGNPPKHPADQLILVWGKQNAHMGPRDIVDPKHAAYDADIDDPDMWDIKTYYGQKFESMVQSMLIEIDGQLQGVRVPISVAKDGSQDGYVVAGRWRTLAARVATNRLGDKGQILVPFTYVPLTDVAIKRQMVLENMNGNRTLKPTRKAAYVAILESFGSSREEIMTACGVTSWQSVENIKALNSLIPEVKELVDTKQMTQTEARQIAEKPKSEQQAIVEKKRTARGDAKSNDDSKRVSPKDMRRIQEVIIKRPPSSRMDNELVLSGAQFMLDYLLSGDMSNFPDNLKKIFEDALKGKKRGPRKIKDDRSDVAYQIQLAAVKKNGWLIRAAIMESIHLWEDEGQADPACQNPDSPDYHCYDQKWYEQYSKMWRKDYANRENQTQSEGAFLKEWLRNLKE